ncbi:hypothetical protein BGX28_003841 [Mortierella sp. GBA30]|nr:hypothetical protein BGX28_003841 [Mortierella sp. GBA30]
MLLLFLTIILLAAYFAPKTLKYTFTPRAKALIPISVNFHFTRRCNYECGFCFHTAITSDMPTIADAKIALAKLAQAGMRKINFAGGEPFLYPLFLGEMVRYCKEELKLESVSIVSNGSRIRRSFFEKYSDYLDILAVSCDSFDEYTNMQIGRGQGNHLEVVQQVADLCREFGVKFKLNTVVCNLNWQEDMNDGISRLRPFRWKCFQVLVLGNENGGVSKQTDGRNAATLRDATSFRVTDEEFDAFIVRHAAKQSSCLVPEPNRLMRNSYLLLDEHLRFLNCRDAGDGTGKVATSRTLLEADVQTLLEEAGWDQEAFFERNGVYDWTNVRPTGNTCQGRKELEW